jgi:hypothetical protein
MAFLACAVWLAPAVTAWAASSGGFAVKPSHSDPADPATRAYFKPVLRPGATLHDSVVVSNLGPSPVDLLVYGVDGLTGQTSGSVYGNRGDKLRKAGAWVTPDASKITVPPRASLSVGFRVRVPAAAAPGDHLAGVAFENAHPQTSGGKFAVREVVREVVGIQITVPGAAAPHVYLGGVRLQSLPGTAFASVVVAIANDGRKLCKPILTVSLRGPNGYRRTATRRLDTVLPGDAIAYPFPWTDTLGSGRYVATASGAGCGPVAGTGAVRVGLGTTLAGVPKLGTTPAATKRAGGGFPTAGVLGIGGFGVLVGLLVGRRPRPKREPR